MLNFNFFTKLNIHIDLAAEAHSLLRGEENREISGVSEKITQRNNLKITEITILNQQGEQAMNRPQGSYITIDAPNLSLGTENLDREEGVKLREDCAAALRDILLTLLPPGDAPILIVGLGNPKITADALGPEVTDLTMATRHLFLYLADHMEEGFGNTAILAPNVMGHTGLEAAESVQAIVSSINAKAVIAVDALAAASVARVGSSLQITDTGITPGGGLGNIRAALNKESIGVPVIAIGVPTVISLGAILGAAIENAQELLEESNTAVPLKEDTAAEIVGRALAGQHEDYAVTPKDVDEMVEILGEVITLGIHLAAHKAMNLSNYHQYLDIRL